MHFTRVRISAAALTVAVSAVARAAVISLVGAGSIAGTATDQSGLSGNILNSADDASTGVANNAFGGVGSGIDYTGSGNLYIMTPDRGPNDGNAQYADRAQYVQIVVDPGTGVVNVTNTATTLLKNSNGQQLTGNSAAITGASPLRFDPEAVRVSKSGDGSYWVSDEYGPYVYHFNLAGQQIGQLNLPAKYGVANSNADGTIELTGNTVGRQSNRGMEGLALTPDGTTLVGMMQNALLQDHALTGTSRNSVYTRIITMDTTTNATHEYVYPLNSKSLGTNDILAVNDHQFLVIERDGNAGNAAAVKQIYLADISGATDISQPFTAGATPYDYSGTTASDGLPASGDIAGVTTVSKSLFLDLLDPAYGLAGSSFPEKIEGLAWGPDFANGDKMLIVTNDNDFIGSNPNNFYVFRIPAAALVPEPASLGILAAGGLALLRRRGR